MFFSTYGIVQWMLPYSAKEAKLNSSTRLEHLLTCIEMGQMDTSLHHAQIRKSSLDSDLSRQYTGKFALWSANDQYYEVFRNKNMMQYVLTYDMREFTSDEVNAKYNELQTELASHLLQRKDYVMKESTSEVTFWEKELRQSKKEKNMLKIVLDKLFLKNSQKPKSIRLVFILH